MIYEEEIVQVRFKFVGSDEIYIKPLTRSQFQNLKESSIIELHNGEIKIKNNPTTFTITIPKGSVESK